MCFGLSCPYEKPNGECYLNCGGSNNPCPDDASCMYEGTEETEEVDDE